MRYAGCGDFDHFVFVFRFCLPRQFYSSSTGQSGFLNWNRFGDDPIDLSWEIHVGPRRELSSAILSDRSTVSAWCCGSRCLRESGLFRRRHVSPSSCHGSTSSDSTPGLTRRNGVPDTATSHILQSRQAANRSRGFRECVPGTMPGVEGALHGERKPCLIGVDCLMCRHAKFRPLARHGTPGRHSKIRHRCDTRKQCRSGDHKRGRRRVF
jgi:hypothetical protein